MRRPLVILASAAALAGCGNDRAQPPDVVTPDPPQGERIVTVKDAGLRFEAPFNWPDLPPEGDRVSGIHSKTARVAIWRYVRKEPLPDGRDALTEVKTLLEQRVRQRDPSFQLRSSEVVERGGADGIEIVGRQTIGGRPYDVRSAHLFEAGTEVVVDAYARPEDFARVDETVFEPLLRSLEVTAP